MPKISELPTKASVAATDAFVVVDKSAAQYVTKQAAVSSVISSFLTLSGGVLSDTSVVAGSTSIRNIIALTQSQYSQISAPNVQTLYLITD